MGIMDFLFGKSNEGDLNKPVAEIYKNLSVQQKYSIMGILFYFQGFCLGRPDANEANKIVFFNAASLGVDIAQAMNFVETRLNTSDSLIRGLQTIRDRAILDSIVYACFCLSKISHKDEAFKSLIAVSEEMGYTGEEALNTIKKIEALGSMFKH